MEYLLVERWSRELWERLSDLSRGREVYFQVFDEEKVPSRRLVLYSLARALRLFETGRNISRSVNIELLLVLSNTRDIKSAIKRLGPREGERAVVVLVLCERDKRLSSSIGVPTEIPVERVLRCLEKISVELGVDTGSCREGSLEERVSCIEKSIMTRLSILED